MGRKKIHYYWTDDVDIGIKKYLSSSNQIERNKIYRYYLQHPFEKMCEIMTRRWKWNYIPSDQEDLKHELVSNLIMKLKGFNPLKGKSFSYFSLITKNYLIQYNDKSYKNVKKRKPIKELDKHGWLDGYGSVGDKKNWTQVSAIIKRKENYDSYIDFLDKHHTEILPDRYHKFVKPTTDYYKDVENTKHHKRVQYGKYMNSQNNTDNLKLWIRHRLDFQKIIRYLFNQYNSKLVNKKSIKSWKNRLKNYVKNSKVGEKQKLLKVEHYECIK